MTAANTAKLLRDMAAEFGRRAAALEAGIAVDHIVSAATVRLKPVTGAHTVWLHDASPYSGRFISCNDVQTGVCHYHASAKFGPRPHMEHPTRWTGFEQLIDAAGRKWSRDLEAVIDDFGDLVEVAL